MMLFPLCSVTHTHAKCKLLLHSASHIQYKHSKSAGALLLHAESHMGCLIRGKSELKWQAHKASAVSYFTMATAKNQQLR